ncbi:GNAT family N-acetyltransferase [Paenibacillus sp. sgz500958]|uniref:GNAT family N-acetyltransferase n=1 Tax=Paenibacillus sp. sgz500958 TaxID=3242475 RepID=UPI0036D3B292
MIIDEREFCVKGVRYTVRSAIHSDARALSALRLQIDGETEHLDREPGEAFIDAAGFEQLIQADSENSRNLFLVAVVQDEIVGFSRCEGSPLRRFAHKVEFGVCVLQEYWGYGIGTNLLRESITWADTQQLTKMTLKVLERNEPAIALYKKLGFEIEGVLKKDKLHSSGIYYNTIVMGRFRA